MKMKFREYMAVFILMTRFGMPMPCRAQNPSPDYPILQMYASKTMTYFAPVGDQTLIFENSGGASNAVIAFPTYAPRNGVKNRKILSQTDFWMDRHGRLHSLSVLKLQVEHNDDVAEKTSGGAYYLSTAEEHGALDRETLFIPHGKLIFRIGKLTDRMITENEQIAALEAAKPGSAALKIKYSNYFYLKIEAAKKRLAALNVSLSSIPLQDRPEIPAPPAATPRLQGLRGLEIPDMTGGSGLDVAVRTPEVIQFGFKSEWNGKDADMASVTPSIAKDLMEKEAAAAQAVGLAENICRDLLAPPCP